MKKRPLIIVMIGPSGSGKSTMAREIVKVRDDKTIIVSRDDIRRMLFTEGVLADYWDQKQEVRMSRENLVTEIEDRMVGAAILKKWNVIIDNTNLRLKYIRKYLKFDAKILTIMPDVNSNLRDLSYRVSERGDDHHVSDDVIKRQLEMFHQLMDNHMCDIREVEKLSEITDKEKRFKQEMERRHFVSTKGYTRPKAIICDLDGTLSIMGDRSPYDGKECSVDIVNRPVRNLLKKYRSDGYRIILVSGRNSDRGGAAATEKWLRENGVNFDVFWMREPGDTRRDAVIKRELYQDVIKDQYMVEFVLDDRQQTVDMWRDQGLVCFQVDKGNF